MNTKLVNALLFAGGAAIGSIVTWQLVKETYQKLAEEEIASVKEHYRKRYDEPKHIEPAHYDRRETPREEAQQTFAEYSNITRSYISPDEERVEYVTEPYVICPELFGECEGYETKSLTYYADGVLADDQGNIVQDADDIVGADFADHFGDYEDDAVHIRSEWAQCDFEILAVDTRYSDIKTNKPHQMEVKWDEMK